MDFNISDDDWNTADVTWGVVGKSVTDEEEEKSHASKGGKTPGARRRTTEVYELSSKYLYRRAFGEDQLLQKFGVEQFKKGYSYHVITGGNVDSLSFLKVILLHQDIKWLLFSTWCIAAEDIYQLDEWLTKGKIKKMDAYFGEILPRTYVVEWRMLNQLFANHQCGRISCFNNHSKVYAGIGEKFPFVIESSANVNTNPRTEQSCITIDDGLVDFYKSYFDNVKAWEESE